MDKPVALLCLLVSTGLSLSAPLFPDSDSLSVTSPKISLDDIFISVKTTQKNHRTRIKLVMDTWYNLAKDQTYFFTDSHDEDFEAVTGSDHWIVTGCSPAHTRQALCCKMGSEFDNFMNTDKKWFCHFDDDNYVNVPKLVSTLQQYDSSKDWYLGRPSTRHPIEIYDRAHLPQRVSFWFATGGAGFCVSRPLAKKMAPNALDGKFIALGENIRLPDDVTVGYLIEHLLGKKLTVLEEFHSHLEMLKNIPQEALAEQVSLSYGGYGREKENTVTVPGYFPGNEDPTRLRSLHCYLHPNSSEICQTLQRR